jgi:hypothetical protein
MMKKVWLHRLGSMLAILAAVLLLLPFVSASARSPQAGSKNGRVTFAGYELIGTVNIPTGTQFEGTEVGGLSSITYDERLDIFYVISDDAGIIDPVRYYTIDIDLADGQLDPGDITILDVTTLLDRSGQPYAPGSLDPEGLALVRPDTLFVSSEGIPPAIDPFVNSYRLNGRQTKAFTVPEKYLPDPAGAQGVRFNLGFETVSVTPNRQFLYTASEGALAQDGPAANLGVSSNARILQYHLGQGRPGREYVYVVNPVPDAPVPPEAFRVNGLVELLPLDNAGTMLAMERGFSVGVGNTVHLYQIQTQGATDVSGYFSLPASFTPVEKTFLLDVETDLGIVPDNLEGMAFGRPLPDGRLPLVLASDNNFAANQVTQFILLAVTLEVLGD